MGVTTFLVVCWVLIVMLGLWVFNLSERLKRLEAEVARLSNELRMARVNEVLAAQREANKRRVLS